MAWLKKMWKRLTGLFAAAVGGGVAVLAIGSQVQFAGVPTVEAHLTPASTQQPVANYEDTTRLHNGDVIGSVLVVNGKILRMSQYRMAGLPEGAYATATMYTAFPVKR